MAVTPEPTQVDARLGRAGELAAYLRDNSSAARRDPEELGREFGVDPAIVSQLQVASKISAKRRTETFDWNRARRRATAAAWQAFAWPPSRPFVFQTLGGLVALACALGPFGSFQWAIRIWFFTEVWCLLAQPRYRNVGYASAMVWLIAWTGSAPLMRTMKSVDFTIVGGPGMLSFLIGMGLATLNLAFGGVLLFISGWIRIFFERRQEDNRSRQDLLSRMFFLQERLATLPPKAETKVHPFLVFCRSHLFLVAAITFFVLAAFRDLPNLAFHIDPEALAGSRRTVAKSASGNVIFQTPGVPGAYLFIQMAVSVLRMAAAAAVAIFATTRKRLALGCLGIAVGEAVAQAWLWPAGAHGTRSIAYAPLFVGGETLDVCLIVLVVRFGIGFNRVMARYRKGDPTDEAAIVSELLEIRHRLSAISVQVYVLVVDAAGSTAMKRGADTLLVEYSFGRYQAWIGETVTRNGGKVDMRTGDGAICAFGDSAQALEAARQLQSGIDAFNTDVNRLELPFRLRVALHAGRVVAELDKVQFTEVIDVAAHVEKYSPVGGIAMTSTFADAAMAADPSIPKVNSPAASVDGLDVFAFSAGDLRPAGDAA